MRDEVSQNEVGAPGTGRISRLIAQKKRKDRVSVYIDGEYAFGVHVSLVADFRLAVGHVLSEAERQELEHAEGELTAKMAALNFIAYRPRTEQEVRKKLASKEVAEPVIDRVIDRLYALKYLDDAAYAKDYAASRFANRGLGPQRIRAELIKRGVKPGLAEAAVRELLEAVDPLEAAREHAEKRWNRLSGETDIRKRRKKVSDYLVRRGFGFETVRRVIDELVAGEKEG